MHVFLAFYWTFVSILVGVVNDEIVQHLYSGGQEIEIPSECFYQVTYVSNSHSVLACMLKNFLIGTGVISASRCCQIQFLGVIIICYNYSILVTMSFPTSVYYNGNSQVMSFSTSLKAIGYSNFVQSLPDLARD